MYQLVVLVHPFRAILTAEEKLNKEEGQAMLLGRNKIMLHYTLGTNELERDFQRTWESWGTPRWL